MTGLMIAVEHGFNDMVSAFIEHKADVNAQVQTDDDVGNATALGIA